jgi:HK97 family phage prohead protease
MNRAYSLLEIKSIDDDERVIEGIATTPTADRYGDVVEPAGAEYKLPMPFLMQHSSREPIGHVIEAKVSKAGIKIKVQLVKIAEPGALKERLDEAWQLIKSGLVRGLSIGFTPIESARIKDTYSEHYLKWSWLETSACVIAANADASITAIKSADQAARRAPQGTPRARTFVRPASTSGQPDASGRKQKHILLPE